MISPGSPRPAGRNLLQWLSVADPRNALPVAWNFAPANLDIVVKSSALF